MDHATISKENMGRMKAAYDAAKAAGGGGAASAQGEEGSKPAKRARKK